MPVNRLQVELRATLTDGCVCVCMYVGVCIYMYVHVCDIVLVPRPSCVIFTENGSTYTFPHNLLM